MTQINWKTMIPSLLFALNEACISMHVYHLNSSQLNSLDQIVSVLVVFAGVAYHHRKSIPTLAQVATEADKVAQVVTPETTGHAPAAE